MKEIKLGSKLYPNMVALVDDEDFENLNKFKWYVKKGRTTFYAFRSVWQKDKKTGTGITMHREIMGVINSDILVDHEDHNGLNNQKTNLRTATDYQNCVNRISQKSSFSKYKGVSFHKGNKKWVAEIQKDYKKMFLGYFKNEIEAAISYNNAALKLHGEFAYLNEVV